MAGQVGFEPEFTFLPPWDSETHKSLHKKSGQGCNDSGGGRVVEQRKET